MQTIWREKLKYQKESRVNKIVVFELKRFEEI